MNIDERPDIEEVKLPIALPARDREPWGERGLRTLVGDSLSVTKCMSMSLQSLAVSPVSRSNPPTPLHPVPGPSSAPHRGSEASTSCQGKDAGTAQDTCGASAPVPRSSLLPESSLRMMLDTDWDARRARPMSTVRSDRAEAQSACEDGQRWAIHTDDVC
jgi:hypothetical protein